MNKTQHVSKPDLDRDGDILVRGRKPVSRRKARAGAVLRRVQPRQPRNYLGRYEMTYDFSDYQDVLAMKSELGIFVFRYSQTANAYTHSPGGGLNGCQTIRGNV